MKSIRLLFTAASIAAGVLAAGGAQAATACSIAARGEALVTVGGQPLALPATPPDCVGAVVARGEVIVCVQDRRSRLQCRPFGAGTTLSAALLGPVDGARGWLDVLSDLLGGEARSAGALNRGAAERALPTGPVAFAAGAITLDPADGWAREVERVDIVDAESGATVATLRGPGRSELARRQLAPGRTYVWTIRSRAAMLDETAGRFSLAGAQELAEVESEINRIDADHRAGPAGRALMLAAWLQQRGLRFDARQVLRSAGLSER